MFDFTDETWALMTYAAVQATIFGTYTLLREYVIDAMDLGIIGDI